MRTKVKILQQNRPNANSFVSKTLEVNEKLHHYFWGFNKKILGTDGSRKHGNFFTPYCVVNLTVKLTKLRLVVEKV